MLRLEDAVREPADRRLCDADNRGVHPADAGGIPLESVSFHRRHDLLGCRGGGHRQDRRGTVPVRAARHFRRALLAAGRLRDDGGDGVVLLFRPAGAGRAWAAEGAPRLKPAGQRQRTDETMSDSEFYSREYNNRVLFPGHPEVMARWADKSARTRSSMICYLDRQ